MVYAEADNVVPPTVILVIAALQEALSVKVILKGASTVAPIAAVILGAIPGTVNELDVIEPEPVEGAKESVAAYGALGEVIFVAVSVLNVAMPLAFVVAVCVAPPNDQEVV